MSRACIERHCSGREVGELHLLNKLAACLDFTYSEKKGRHILIERIHMLLEKSRAISFKCISSHSYVDSTRFFPFSLLISFNMATVPSSAPTATTVATTAKTAVVPEKKAVSWNNLLLGASTYLVLLTLYIYADTRTLLF